MILHKTYTLCSTMLRREIFGLKAAATYCNVCDHHLHAFNLVSFKVLQTSPKVLPSQAGLPRVVAAV